LTRTGALHTLVKRKQAGDYRLALPSTIYQALVKSAQSRPDERLWCAQNLTATWVVCYLFEILPDQTMEGWERMECSHRCAFNEPDRFCVEPRCLVWETKADNQSRGNMFCTRFCKHAECIKTVCECQEIHTPACL